MTSTVATADCPGGIEGTVTDCAAGCTGERVCTNGVWTGCSGTATGANGIMGACKADGSVVEWGNIVSASSFDNGSLRDFVTVQCGGPSGTCPATDGRHGQYPTTDTPESLLTAWNYCSNPSVDPYGCRFYPSFQFGSGVMFFTVKAGGTEGSGDYNSGFKGPRNELVFTREDNIRKEYVDGDNRYYAWNTYFPSTYQSWAFPDPQDYTTVQSAFNTFFQFHANGECHPGIPLALLAVRTDTTAGRQRGDKYQIILSGDNTYNAEAVDKTEEHRLFALAEAAASQGTALAGHSQLMKDHLYKFVLHVKWSTRACSTPCNWDNPDGGAVELWVNGTTPATATTPGTTNTLYRVYAKERITMPTWPSTSPCSGDNDEYINNAVANTGMKNHVKLGLYRDRHLTNAATVVHDTFRVGKSCLSVFPNATVCPR